MALTRLGTVAPGRLAIFAGSLSLQSAVVLRQVVAEMERLGYGMLWWEARAGKLRAGRDLSGCDRPPGRGERHRQHLGAGPGGHGGRRPLSGGGLAGSLCPGFGVSHAPIVSRRGHLYERPCRRCASTCN